MIKVLAINEGDGPLGGGFRGHRCPLKKITPPGPYGVSDGEQVRVSLYSRCRYRCQASSLCAPVPPFDPAICEVNSWTRALGEKLLGFIEAGGGSCRRVTRTCSGPFRRRSPADSPVGPSAPPGSHTAPPAKGGAAPMGLGSRRRAEVG